MLLQAFGAVSGLGVGTQAQFQKAVDCSSGITTFTKSTAIPVDLPCASLIKEDLSFNLDANSLSMFDRTAHLSWLAANEALQQSGLNELNDLGLDRSGIFWGTGFGGSNTLDSAYQEIFLNGKQRARPFTIIGVMANGSAGLLAIQTGFKGPSMGDLLNGMRLIKPMPLERLLEVLNMVFAIGQLLAAEQNLFLMLAQLKRGRL